MYNMLNSVHVNKEKDTKQTKKKPQFCFAVSLIEDKSIS